MQGWRTSMEDSHTHILSLPDEPSTTWFSVYGESLPASKCQSASEIIQNFLFLDGHGGSIVAKYASKHLHKFIIQRPEFPSDIPEALKQVSDNLTVA
jgi:protein phosphatase PTC2/3